MSRSQIPKKHIKHRSKPSTALTAPSLDIQDKNSNLLLNDPTLYVNRELGLLAFQRRVLEEAQDESNPLLERVKFLSILGSNLDEFFMVRVAGLKIQLESGAISPGPDALTPVQQLLSIRNEVLNLLACAHSYVQQRLLPALSNEGIKILDYHELTPAQHAFTEDYFLNTIFPVLTPLAFDPSRPFPHISNLSLNLAVLIRDTSGNEKFARIKVPDTLPQFVSLERLSQNFLHMQQTKKESSYVLIEDIIAAHLSILFPGMEILDVHPFHVTRNAEMAIQELEAADLLETTEEGLRQRRFGDVVRLQVNKKMPMSILQILMSNLEITMQDVYHMQGKLILSRLKYLYNIINRTDLKYPSFVPVVPTILQSENTEEDIFSVLKQRDIVLHHPYDSFQPITDFLRTSARDPHVLAIKMTLYRVGSNSPLVESLLDATEYGKQVAVLVELKARFDEESNIEWAKALESGGVHVVYGLLGLKVHSKVALVVRKENDIIKRYVHIGSGNYNPFTAHAYSDIGIFTSQDDIGADVSDLFNYLTGYSAKTDYKQLLVAPINLRQKLAALIKREIQWQETGHLGHMILKMNALVDPAMIALLYEASRAGVKIDLLVRGICCLRPGIPGTSENIRVISIVGRFLEHSRIYYFCNGGTEEIYIGSADLMPRNLDRRVEVLSPIREQRLIRFIKDEILETYLQDRAKSRLMLPDGSYVRLTQNSQDQAPFNAQMEFISRALTSKDKLPEKLDELS